MSEVRIKIKEVWRITDTIMDDVKQFDIEGTMFQLGVVRGMMEVKKALLDYEKSTLKGQNDETGDSIRSGDRGGVTKGV